MRQLVQRKRSLARELIGFSFSTSNFLYLSVNEFTVEEESLYHARNNLNYQNDWRKDDFRAKQEQEVFI